MVAPLAVFHSAPVSLTPNTGVQVTTVNSGPVAPDTSGAVVSGTVEVQTNADGLGTSVQVTVFDAGFVSKGSFTYEFPAGAASYRLPVPFFGVDPLVVVPTDYMVFVQYNTTGLAGHAVASGAQGNLDAPSSAAGNPVGALSVFCLDPNPAPGCQYKFTITETGATTGGEVTDIVAETD